MAVWDQAWPTGPGLLAAAPVNVFLWRFGGVCSSPHQPCPVLGLHPGVNRDSSFSVWAGLYREVGLHTNKDKSDAQESPMWPLLQEKSADSETLFTGTDVAFSSPGCCILSVRGLSGAPASSRDRGSPSHPVPWAWVDTSLILLSRGLLGGSWWPVWWITCSSPFFTRCSPPLPPHPSPFQLRVGRQHR